MQNAKFKIGDRVVITKRTPYMSSRSVIDAQGMKGIIQDYDYGYGKMHVLMDGFEEDRFFTTFESYGELVHEVVYNSPLYKALQEAE